MSLFVVRALGVARVRSVFTQLRVGVSRSYGVCLAAWASTAQA